MSELTSRKALSNFIWIISSKVIQSALGLVISVLTARYLGTANFGVINYAASVVNFVLPFVRLGLSSVMVQEIIKNRNKEGEITGSAIALSLTSSLVCYVGILIFAFFVNAGEKETILCCAIYGISLFFESLQLINYWFQAVLLSKYISILSVIAYVVVSGYKIFLLVCEANVYWFALSYSIDYGIIAIGGLVIFKRLSGKSLEVNKKTCKFLLHNGKYFILSGIMVTIFAQTDKIMIKNMIDDSATGIYSAALACAGLTGFVYGAIVDTMRPVILESKLKDEETFEKNMTVLFSVIIYMSLIIGIATSLLSDWIILFLYGEEYASAASVLKIAAWGPLFTYLGVGRDIWMIANNQHSKLWLLNFCGAILNIVLNLIFIPRLGAVGAAVASVIAKCFSFVFLVAMIKPISRCAYLMLRGISPKNLISLIKKKVG